MGGQGGDKKVSKWAGGGGGSARREDVDAISLSVQREEYETEEAGA